MGFSKFLLRSIPATFVLLSVSFTFAAEPLHCSVKHFLKHEIKAPAIYNAKAFQFGDAVLVFGGIGRTDARAVVRTAKLYSDPITTSSDKYCTWYYNEGNVAAEKSFHHVYLPNPNRITLITATAPALAMMALAEMGLKYDAEISPLLNPGANNFMSCIERNKYLAMGCNGQKHRGPTVFAMLLAYSGCSPKTSVDVAVSLWGRNWVLDTTRQLIASHAYNQGSAHADERLKWQRFFQER